MSSRVDWNRDTHALVRFIEEDKTAVVPVDRIQRKDTLEYGGSCRVVWSNKKIYKAFLICSGSREHCAERQDEIEEESESEDANGNDEGAMNPPKRIKTFSGGKVKKAQKTKSTKTKKASTQKNKKDDKRSESDFVIHVGAAPPSIVTTPTSTVTSAPTSAVLPSTVTRALPSLVTSTLPSTVIRAPPSLVTSALLSTVTTAPPSLVTSALPSTVTMAPPSLVTSELPSTVTKAPPSSVTSALPSTVTRAPPSIVISASPSTVTSAPPSVVLPSTVTRAPPSEMISALPSTVTTARLSVVTSTPPSVMTSSQDYLAEDTEDMHSSDYNTTDADSEEDESSLDTTHKIHKIIVTNSPPDRRRQPIHYYSKQYTSELDQLREEIKRQNEEQKAWMEEKFTEIKKQIELLMASGIARTLTPLLGHPAAYQLGGTTTNAISVSGVNACASVATTVTSPVTATFSNAAAVSTTPAVITPVTAPVEGLVSTCNASETLAAGDLSRLSEPEVVNPEVTVSTENLELIPHADLVKIFTKGKNRPHFAALLVAKLFDEETRLKSNVRGKGKKQKLDPTIIQWVKGKCFEYHPTEGNLQSEWDKCIQAIDTKNRSIKRKQAYRNELSNDQ